MLRYKIWVENSLWNLKRTWFQLNSLLYTMQQLIKRVLTQWTLLNYLLPQKTQYVDFYRCLKNRCRWHRRNRFMAVTKLTLVQKQHMSMERPYRRTFKGKGVSKEHETNLCGSPTIPKDETFLFFITQYSWSDYKL